MNNSTTLDKRSIELRKVIVETMIAGNRGHLASALSLVEMIMVLYDDILKYDSNAPKWEKRDRLFKRYFDWFHNGLPFYSLGKSN